MAEIKGNLRNATQKLTGNIKSIGAKGDKGDPGVGIVSTVLNADYTLTITLSDGTSYTTESIRGEKGETGSAGAKGDKGDKGDPGVSVVSAVLNADYTLTLTLSDGTAYTTPSIRGEKGEKGEPGDDYILTPSDKAEIAELVDIIDDTAGAGDTDKAWSADKIVHELESAGSVKDVTVNGESIVDSESGVAEIPVASSSAFGVVKINKNYGVNTSSGQLVVYESGETEIKAGNVAYRPITPTKQHMSTFYGLAKAAGADMKNSANPIGTYTEEAKVAIRNMIDATGESASVTVTGTDPVIQASRNTRYICGEILSLDFTPCASGICEVIFTSGSSVTVLTLPETIKMPEWFEVETNHTYEISVVDGVYGAVMVW